MMGDASGAQAFAGMTPQGGTLGGVQTLVSDGLPSGYLVALDATQIAAGSEGLFVSSSTEATVAMDGAPDSPPIGTTVLTRLWQADLVASRIERYFGAQRLRAGAVAAISGVNYSGNSPP